MSIWLLYYVPKGQCHRSNLLSPLIVVSLYQSDFKYRSQDSCCGLYVIHSRLLVPGYISHRRLLFCQWPISPGSDQRDPGKGSWPWVISIDG